MKVIFWIGLIVLILGIASLLVPVPSKESKSVEVGDLSLGVETRTDEKIPPAASAVMILGGAGMIVAGRKRR